MQPVWQAVRDGDAVHIVPKDDRREHMLSELCWCEPTRDPSATVIWVHHALDRREAFE